MQELCLLTSEIIIANMFYVNSFCQSFNSFKHLEDLFTKKEFSFGTIFLFYGYLSELFERFSLARDQTELLEIWFNKTCVLLRFDRSGSARCLSCRNVQTI
ncbi:hypothetical protein CHS0354_007507 [Potamilus streckersoni]|uniref:Uncharacterized protein n=1 Tax=Potamilus streckersoni TaxID=2493646 RepID=A0AAE0T8X0_9BIVA|nr:hypothetical protein CHS0354_007507 [Potamilus streckersoni]